MFAAQWFSETSSKGLSHTSVFSSSPSVLAKTRIPSALLIFLLGLYKT